MKMFSDVKDDLGQFIAVKLVCYIITRNHLLLQARPEKPSMEATERYRRQCVCNGSKDKLCQYPMNLLLDMSSLMLLDIYSMNYVTGLSTVTVLTLSLFLHFLYGNISFILLWK